MKMWPTVLALVVVVEEEGDWIHAVGVRVNA
jgi:hypothetical protein